MVSENLYRNLTLTEGKICNFIQFYIVCLWSWNSHNILVTYLKHRKRLQGTGHEKRLQSTRFNKTLFHTLACSSRNDGENNFPYLGCGAPALQRSNSKMSCKWKIRELHLGLDVTRTRIRHSTRWTSFYMRIQVSRRQSMPKF